MIRSARRFLVTTVGAILLLTALPAGIPAAPIEPAAPTTVVEIVGKSYDPNPSQVYVGSDIGWDNTTNSKHSATASGDLRPFFDTGTIRPGKMRARDITAVGTFPYRCTYHKGMKGKVNSGLYTDAVPGSTVTPLQLTLGTKALPKGFRFQVQSRPDSSGPQWEIIVQGRQLLPEYQYTQAGNYDIRARVQNKRTGAASKWSGIWSQPIA